ncbi:LacI family transcriptional regulator [Hypnocyclicus thermotrophus]|uniref:LacI family transcriptional regulator n=1 Tax=Hypnocyclicus thermotrophus TaxID=1627895 RepID=A0AA46E0L1_9FUSO|nr:LacI family DNA-binding transcriptional regulator [Hypnocyclicus thermotrophus]TDT72288.1 LacI family transcriptional regulator [Hypnocyclicus thermotrophus]
MSKIVKLKDVAKLAGVGIGTASRVLNEHPNVKDSTRRKVLDAMRELNYTPNNIARSLKSKSTRTIGVILIELSSAFYSDIVEGIEDTANEYGYSIFLNNTRKYEDRILESIQMMCEKKVDGIIYLGGTLTEEIQNKLLDANIPVVLISTGTNFKRKDTTEVFSSINIDNETAAFEAVTYLCELKHKKIAMLTINKDDKNSAMPRIKGYRRALEKNGIEFNDDLVFECEQSYQSGYETMQKILKLEERPTAIFSYSDLIALGASRAILQSGLRIPEDISIVGFDDIETTKYFYPAITTMRQPRYVMGSRGMELLIREINDKEGFKQHVILPVTLQIRESTSQKIKDLI